jgi:hypothetical protein
MFAGDFYLSFIVILFSHLTSSTEALSLSLNNVTVNSLSTDNTTINRNVSMISTSTKNRLIQGKELIHDAFANMDRGTLMRGTIVLAGITCLFLMYVGIKTFL